MGKGGIPLKPLITTFSVGIPSQIPTIKCLKQLRTPMQTVRSKSGKICISVKTVNNDILRKNSDLKQLPLFSYAGGNTHATFQVQMLKIVDFR